PLLQEAHQIVAALGALLCCFGGFAHDGEDCAFNGFEDGAVGQTLSFLERVGKIGGVEGLLFVKPLGKATQNLGEDDARVSTRTHQCSVCQFRGNRASGGIVAVLNRSEERRVGKE